MIRESEQGSALRITSFDSRVSAGAGACLPAVVAMIAGAIVFGARPGSPAYADRPVSAVVMVVFAVAALWGFVRAARVATEFGPEEIVVRNPWRTYRIAWSNVAWFGNGTVWQGGGGFAWALAIGIATPAHAICCESTAPTKRFGMGEVKKAIHTFSVAYAVPERFDESRTAVAPGTSWLYDKLRLRGKH